jgi:hypothetical protein
VYTVHTVYRKFIQPNLLDISIIIAANDN